MTHTFKRYFRLLAVLFLAPLTVLANRIDSLKTDQEVLDFLKSINADFRNPKFNEIQLRDNNTLRKDLACNGVADSWQLNNWVKSDLDGNGLTDLVVMLYWYDYGVYVVMDKSGGRFDMIPLSKNISDKCEMAKPVVIDNKPYLLYYLNKKTDTLVYRNGGFIEMKANQSVTPIDSVIFRTGYCFGSCPVFLIRFDSRGQAAYEAKTYNPKQGNFAGTIDSVQLNEILDLLSYADVRGMKNDYKVSWTDDQTSWLIVKYSDGTVKEIRDYGMQGNFALRLLYSRFFDLRTSQEWR